MTTMQPPPARAAHGLAYWLLIGWWWAPAKWVGRVSLWVFLLPVGIWRSVRHGRKVREERHRRGWEQHQSTQPPPVN